MCKPNQAIIAHSLERFKDVFQFLLWKSSIHPEHFTSEDQNIINNHDLENFSCLSIKGCSYSKIDIKHYSEKLWQYSINSQYQLEGFTEAPRVSTTSGVTTAPATHAMQGAAP